jgi:ankyrin repeat protein
MQTALKIKVIECNIMSLELQDISGKTALHCAVEEDNLELAAQFMHQGADVNARMVDLEKLNVTREMLMKSVTPYDINDLSRIPIPYDITVSVVYAVCLITYNDFVQPEMTLFQVW